MYRLWKDYRLWFLLAFIIVALFAMLETTPGRMQEFPPMRIVMRAYAPVESLIANFTGNLRSGGEFLRDLLAISREVGQLREENKQLRLQQLILQDLRLENHRLRRLLDFQEQLVDTEHSFAAQVIGRNPSQWFQSVMIDRGSEDGVAVGMTAVNDRGLIGRVVEVALGSSMVRLLTDPNSGVGVTVQRSREQGVAVGRLAGDQSLLVRFFSQDTDVRVGDELVSSGKLSRSFPSGIPIGVVRSIQVVEQGLIQEAVVQPWADFNRLEEIMIIPFLPEEGQSGS